MITTTNCVIIMSLIKTAAVMSRSRKSANSTKINLTKKVFKSYFRMSVISRMSLTKTAVKSRVRKRCRPVITSKSANTSPITNSRKRCRPAITSMSVITSRNVITTRSVTVSRRIVIKLKDHNVAEDRGTSRIPVTVIAGNMTSLSRTSDRSHASPEDEEVVVVNPSLSATTEPSPTIEKESPSTSPRSLIMSSSFNLSSPTENATSSLMKSSRKVLTTL
jgi:hypothetical protein